MSIQRYDVVFRNEGYEKRKDVNGDYVIHSDHLAALESARLAGAEEMRELAAQVTDVAAESFHEAYGPFKTRSEVIRSLTLPKKG